MNACVVLRLFEKMSNVLLDESIFVGCVLCVCVRTCVCGYQARLGRDRLACQERLAKSLESFYAYPVSRFLPSMSLPQSD